MTYLTTDKISQLSSNVHKPNSLLQEFSLSIAFQTVIHSRQQQLTTTTRLSPYVHLHSILEHSGSLQNNYFGSIAS